MITIILVLIIIGAVTIFSIQNAKPIEVSFLLWNFKASQAIIIFLSMLTGVVTTVIIFFSRYIKRSVKKQNKPSG
ncbi:MAG: LapA family protein [Nitrospirota bacterium]|nr:LapA family protein [Nitrospirota bacterium]